MGKIYGAKNTPVYRATALSDNPGFDAATFMSKWESEKGVMLYPPTVLQIVALSANTSEARVTLDRGGGVLDKRTIFSYTTGAYNDEGAVWGFASEPQNGDFTSTQESRSLTKQVNKLYGSVNGQTKAIRKLYGSVNGLTKLIHQE